MSQFFESIVERLALLFDPQELGVAAGDIVGNLIIGAITFLLAPPVEVGVDSDGDRDFRSRRSAASHGL